MKKYFILHEELYNLENDPAEQNKLADSLPDLAAKMLFDLQSW